MIRFNYKALWNERLQGWTRIYLSKQTSFVIKFYFMDNSTTKEFTVSANKQKNMLKNYAVMLKSQFLDGPKVSKSTAIFHFLVK